MQATDTDRARDALFAIPADLPRDAWVKTGMAFHAAGGDFDSFDQWSAQADTYNAQACRAAYRSFKTAPGGVGAGTLFGMARDHGWQEGTESPYKAPAKPDRTAKRKPDANTVQAPCKPGMSAVEVWGRCLPATGHPYATQKGASVEAMNGLRVVPAADPLRIMSESMAGALVVPVLRPDGTTSSLQLIPPPEVVKRLKAAGRPGKLNLPGCKVDGWFTVGTLAAGAPTYIVEGIGQAWACWQATGCAAVVAFGAGNMGKVATALRQMDDTARLVLVPDAGKEDDAHRIAADTRAAVAVMPEGEPDNFDVNDLYQRDGFDTVAALLEAATEPPKPEPLLKPVPVFDLFTNPSPPPAFVWDGYLPRGVVSLIGAHGGMGKSTIALMLAVCAALGRPLFGVDTEATSALFVSLEDGADVVRHRLAGICKAWLIDPEQLRDRLHIVDGTEHPELFSAETRSAGETTGSYAELRKLVQATGAGLVLIDNASDAYGADEIKRREVRAFIRALGSIAKHGNCSVVLLAHVDKTTSRNKKADGGEGYSGSTAWHNSVRSRLFLSRGDDGLLTLEHQKSNLGRMREPLTLNWLEGGFPQLVEGGSFDNSRQQARADDDRAAALLRLISEFEGRGQYCSPATTARNNPYAMLRSEPDFQKLKLNSDLTKRIVNQCQRARWIEPLDYKSAHTRKYCQRWTLTPEGYSFAGMTTPSAPTAPTCHEGDDVPQGANVVHPLHPHMQGVRGNSAHTEQGAKLAQSEGATA